MKKKVFLISQDDLQYYPPTISLIRALLDLGLEVVCVGIYSDAVGKRDLEGKGVKFVPISIRSCNNSGLKIVNWIKILYRILKYKREIRNFFNNEEVGNNDIIWYLYTSSLPFIHNYIENNDFVIQFYEFEDYSNKGKIRFFNPKYSPSRTFNKARALIHCEYNRAMITNALYDIKKAPIVLPNKPYLTPDLEDPQNIPEDVRILIKELELKSSGKNIILYQGVFNSLERRLEEFCEAMDLLPDNFVFVAMGKNNDYYKQIKQKFVSPKIVFLPFIRPPYHLLITKMAKYGVLTYFPAGRNYVDVINPLYCAPNKIFEYGKYGIPMISNDVPGLKLIFETYHCGATISMPVTPKKIEEAIMGMEINYNGFLGNSRAYYDSVNYKQIVRSVIEN